MLVGFMRVCTAVPSHTEKLASEGASCAMAWGVWVLSLAQNLS